MKKAFAYSDKMDIYQNKIRENIDSLETEIDDELWPLVKYRELLFTK